MFLDPPLDNLSDILEGSGVLVHHVVAEGYAVADVRSVAQHLQDSVEAGTCFVKPVLLQCIN